jgi:uncharacterized protein YdeI (YjbR/CyaY-like superfamily)
MKLTIKRLKKLIRESMDNMDKLRKMVASGEEGRNMALELATGMKIPKEEVEKMDAPWAFELPYGQRPKWALRQEIEKFEKILQNSTNATEQREIEQYLEGLKEELYDY